MSQAVASAGARRAQRHREACWGRHEQGSLWGLQRAQHGAGGPRSGTARARRQGTLSGYGCVGRGSYRQARPWGKHVPHIKPLRARPIRRRATARAAVGETCPLRCQPAPRSSRRGCICEGGGETATTALADRGAGSAPRRAGDTVSQRRTARFSLPSAKQHISG